MGDADPIRELVATLETDERPPLAWALRWSAGGYCPVHTAWLWSEDADAMLCFLARFVPDYDQGYSRAHELAEAALYRAGLQRSDRRAPDRIRAAWPWTPTLAEVLEVGHEHRAHLRRHPDHDTPGGRLRLAMLQFEALVFRGRSADHDALVRLAR